jgi:hypothetical protein
MSRRRPPLFSAMVLVVALVVGLPAAALAAYTAAGSNTAPATAATFPAPGAPTAQTTTAGVTLTWAGTQLSTGRKPDSYEVRRTVAATTTVICTTTTALTCTDSEQTQTVTYRVVAKVGGWTSISASTTYTPDLTAPVSTFVVQPAVNAAGWVLSSNPQITITAADQGGSGVASISYEVGAASTVTTNGSSVTFNVNQQGTVAIRYWATDNVGNVETPRTTTLNIDGIAPPITGLKISNDSGTSSSDFVTNVAAQTLSGTSEPGAVISATYNGTTKTAIPNGSGAWSMTFTLVNGSTDAVVTATDGAGNATTATQAIRLDTVAPTATVQDPDAGVGYTDAAWSNTCSANGGPGICGTSTDGSGSGVGGVTYKLEHDPAIGNSTCFNGTTFVSSACNTMRAVTTGPNPWWASVPTSTIPNTAVGTSTMRLTITVTDIAGNATTTITTFTKD